VSARATGWVYRHSPFRGAVFAVHLSIADSVNDQNDNEFWMRMDRLAKKARVKRQTASSAVAELERAGLLVCLQRSKGRKAVRWQFVMPVSQTVVYDDSSTTEPPKAPVPAGQSADNEAPGSTVTTDDGSAGPGPTVIPASPTVVSGDGQLSAEPTAIRATQERTQTEPLAAAPDGPSADRARDAVWDGFVAWIGKAPAKTIKIERDRWNTAAGLVRGELDYRPAEQPDRYSEVRLEVRRRAAVYDRTYPRAPRTPMALAGRWGECGPRVEAPPELAEPPSDASPPAEDRPCGLDGCTERHATFAEFYAAHPKKSLARDRMRREAVAR
jgi:hypothetical protein